VTQKGATGKIKLKTVLKPRNLHRHRSSKHGFGQGWAATGPM
jgi:hypothetical protein